MLNLWVKTIGKEDDRAVTRLKKRSLYGYVWVTDNYIFFIQDEDGNDINSLYVLNLETKEIKRLTPKDIRVKVN